MQAAHGHDVRLRTGITGLDEILGGGLWTGSTYLLAGEPGTGKTIFANQIAFKLAAQGKQAIYVTLLAETHARLIGGLRGFDFFDESAVSSRIHYMSAYQTVEAQGLDGLRPLVQQLVQSKSASLLVIDGMSAIDSFSLADAKESPRFFHSLQFLTELTGCTTLLVFNRSDSPNAYDSLVDGIIALYTEPQALSEHHYLNVRKFRGGSTLHGRHDYKIGQEGVHVFPRLETAHQTEIARANRERLEFALPVLNRMLGRGVDVGSSTFLVGGPASGKSRLGKAFLDAGVKRGEFGVYFSFHRPPQWVESAAGEKLHVRWKQPFEILLDETAQEIFDVVESCQVRRLFLDGLDGMFLQSGGYRMPSFLPLLLSGLRSRGVTTVASLTASARAASDLPPAAQFADNLVLLLQIVDEKEVRRRAVVLKTGHGDFDPRVHEFRVTPHGITFEGNVSA